MRAKKNRIQTWLALIVLAVGLLFAAILGLSITYSLLVVAANADCAKTLLGEGPCQNHGGR